MVYDATTLSMFSKPIWYGQCQVEQVLPNLWNHLARQLKKPAFMNIKDAFSLQVFDRSC